jgi:hypothetical protein
MVVHSGEMRQVTGQSEVSAGWGAEPAICEHSSMLNRKPLTETYSSDKLIPWPILARDFVIGHQTGNALLLHLCEETR